MRRYLIRGGIIIAALFIFCGKSNAQVIELACPAGTQSLQALQTTDTTNTQIRQNYCINSLGQVFQNTTGITAAILNNKCYADQQTGNDFIAKIRACIPLLPASGGTIDATGFSGTQDATSNITGNPFNSTKPFLIRFGGGAVFKFSKTWFTNNNKQYFTCEAGAILDFEPSGTISGANQNDRAIAFGAIGISANLNRPITGTIAIGATSFTATNAGDTSDLQAGDWLDIHEADTGIGGELYVIDQVQVLSVAGTTVNVQRPFRTAFPNTHSGTTFDRYPIGAGVAEDGGISNCNIISNQSATSTPAIDVHFGTRNIWVENNTIQNAFGQPIYLYRSQGAHVLGNTIRIMNGAVELANSTDWVFSGNILSTEGSSSGNPPFTGSASLTIDYGASFFTFSNNVISDSPGHCYFINDGPHDGTISNNICGFLRGSSNSAFVLRGINNMMISSNKAIGSTGGAGSFGLTVGNSTNMTVQLISSGNIATGNRITGFPAGQNFDSTSTGIQYLQPEQITLSGSTSGITTLAASAVAGSTTATLPANTGTIAETNINNNFSVIQTGTALVLTGGLLQLNGATSGNIQITVPAISGSNTATFPAATGTIALALTTSFTTTSATTDNVTVTGMTANGHCSLTATNAGAAGGIASVFISAKTTNQITVTHTATAGWTFDVSCTPN